MKQLKFLLAFLFLVGSTTKFTYAQTTQAEVWSLGDKTYNFNQLTPIDNLPLGDPNIIISNYPYLANNLTDAQKFVYNGEKPVFSQNVVYDDNGAVKFFIIDGNVYDQDGILLANGVWNLVDYTGYSYFLPEGNSETTIIPVPGKCNSYYIIAATYADELGYSSDLTQRDVLPNATIYYYEIDFNEDNFDYPDRKGFVNFKEKINVDVLQCGSIHIAATEPVNSSNNRFLYISVCADLIKCSVTQNGISPVYFSPLLDSGFGFESNMRAEIEVIKKGNLLLFARPIDYDPTWNPFSASNFFQYVEIREFRGNDGEGEFPTTDGRRVFYLSFELNPTTHYHITGLEISPSGNMIYVATKEAPYLWFAELTYQNFPQANTTGSPYLYYKLLNPVSFVTPFTIDADYLGSQLELGSDGRIYMYAGKDNLLAISNLDDSNNPIVDYLALNLNNPASSGTDIQVPNEFYYCHLLNDQVDGEDYASFNSASPQCCSDFVVYNTKNVSISTNTVWNTTSAPWGVGDGLVEDDLVVESGAKLTINGRTLKFSRNAKLIVKQGGSLVLNNSTLTSVDCEGVMWKGVEVYGTQGVAHSTQFNSAYGTVVLQGNSVISNAINGITTCPRDANNNFDLVSSGGYIIATNSSFINNRVDVEVTPHIYSGFPMFPPAQITKTTFKNCNFKSTTSSLKDQSNPEAHVKLTQVRGVKFYANTFINTDNTNPIILQRGTGILSVDSKFDVTYTCSTPQLPGNPCPEQFRIGNRFENLYYGINATAILHLNNLVVEHSNFVNTHRGIKMTGMYAAKIDENNFEVGAFNTGTNIESHGIYMDNCNKYFCQNNTFSTNNTGDYGIITVNSNVDNYNSNNEIRNNIFTGLKYGATASLDNFDTEVSTGLETGLQYLCNEFYTSSYVDIQVPSGGVHNNQGGCNTGNSSIPINEQPANNTFSFPVPTGKHFSVNSQVVQHPTYYIHAANNLSTFDIIPDNSQTGVYNNTPCGPANFPVIKSDVCPEREYTKKSTRELFTNFDLRKNEIIALYSLIDANNTQGLLNAIATQSNGQVKNLLLSASPYLSDEVLIAYISSTPPAGHLKQVIIDNSPVSDEVMLKLNSINIPNGIRNQINAAQTGTSPRQDLMSEISAVTFSKDGYSDELFRRYLNDTTDNKLDSLEYLLLYEPSAANENIRVGVKIMQADYIGAQALINDIRSVGNANENYLKLMESLIIIYQCQDKAYRLKWDLPLKAEVEAIATTTPVKIECKNAGALLELLKELNLPELYEVININDVRSMFEETINEKKEQSFLIYPNPGTDFVNVQTVGLNEVMVITIYDLSGKAIYSAKKSSTDYMMIDVSTFAKGMYFINVNTDGLTLEVQKLVIE